METPARPRGDDAAAARSSGPLAGIDLGSNSFRLEIGQVADSRYRRIDYLKETVRLGAGLDGAGVLSEEAAGRGLACLARFAQRLEGFGPAQVRAVATQTLREAKNRDAFLARAQATLGFPIEVVSGREEARLIYSGVAHLQPTSVPRLVVDIGGRSTEMIIGHGLHAERAESFQVGSVSLSMRYFADGRFSERAFHDAQVAAGAELEEALEPFAPRHWKEALGSSGTVGAVAQILAASHIGDGSITPDSLRWLIQRCLEAGSAEQLALPGLKDDRRVVIGGGLSILYTLATHFGIAQLKPARGALRQGVIFDLAARAKSAGRAAGEDLREGSVGELQRRFTVDTRQADRVARVASALLAEAQPRTDAAADGEADRELRWAAALHESGMMISHHDHHRHSAYVLAHADAPGFSQSQMRRIGDLVLGQRGGLRKIESRLQDASFALHVLCLRLAVIVCHARDDVDAGAIRLAGGPRPLISLSAAWADAHPRAVFLLREEAEAWAKIGVLAPQLAIDR